MVASGSVLPAQATAPVSRRMDNGIQMQGHHDRVDALMTQIRRQLLREDASPHDIAALRIELGQLDRTLREMGQPQAGNNGASRSDANTRDPWHEPIDEPAAHLQEGGGHLNGNGRNNSVAAPEHIYPDLAQPLAEGRLDVPLTC